MFHPASCVAYSVVIRRRTLFDNRVAQVRRKGGRRARRALLAVSTCSIWTIALWLPASATRVSLLTNGVKGELSEFETILEPPRCESHSSTNHLCRVLVVSHHHHTRLIQHLTLFPNHQSHRLGLILDRSSSDQIESCNLPNVPTPLPDMAAQAVTEGEVAFDAPGAGKPCKTWYKIIGRLDSGAIPLIALHGGPGGGHEYLTPLEDLHSTQGIPIIFYDQIGCARSTHLQEKKGDDSFWTFDLFVKELDNLVDHLQLRESGFYVLGQSWGGMLGSTYASRQPRGLKKLVLVSSPASIPLYMENCKILLAGLPRDVRDTLEECDRLGDHESERFQAAALVFNKKHVCRIDPMPEPVMKAFEHLKEDPTSYITM